MTADNKPVVTQQLRKIVINAHSIHVNELVVLQKVVPDMFESPPAIEAMT